MKQLYLFLMLLTAGLQLMAQRSYDSSFRFYYYDQKLSLFEQMPVKRGSMLWLGDSITDGGEWHELFPGYRTVNRGISSDNTFGVLNRLHEVIRHKPAKLFILIGINDIARGIPNDVILRNYQLMLQRLQQETPGTRIYVQSVLPTNNSFTQFKNHQNKTAAILEVNEALKKMCTERGIVFVDLYNAFVNENGKLHERYTNDGLHLTGEGYLKWKAVLQQQKCL